PGRWEKRVVTYKPKYNGKVYLNVVLYGNPATVWLDDLTFTTKPYNSPSAPSLAPLPKKHSKSQTLSILSKRPSLKSRIAVRDGQSMLFINNIPVTPVLYKNLSANRANYAGFHGAGINITTVRLKLGMMRGRPGIWSGPGKFNF